jgi:hypothetical protein
MAPPAIYKNNFFVDYANTYYGWSYRQNPFNRDNQVEPVRGNVDGIRQDQLRIHHGAMWSYYQPGDTPDHLVWRRTTAIGDGPLESPEAVTLNSAIEHVISGVRIEVAATADPPYLVNWDDIPAPPGGAPGTDPFPFETGPARNNIPYSRKFETIRIEANFEKAASHFGSLPSPTLAWRQWVAANYYGRDHDSGVLYDYYDHACEYQSPFTPRENLYGSNRYATAYSNYDYNFYTRQYEQLINQELAFHSILPHQYTMYFEKLRNLGNGPFGTAISPTDEPFAPTEDSPMIGEPGYNDDFLYSDFTTLSRAIKNVFVDSIRFDPEPAPGAGPIYTWEKSGEADRYEYYDIWANIYNDIIRGLTRVGTEVGRFVNKYRNLIFSADAVGTIQEINPYKQLFPMYTDLSFPISDSIYYTPIVMRPFPSEISLNPFEQIFIDFRKLGGTMTEGEESLAIPDPNFSINLTAGENHQAPFYLVPLPSPLATSVPQTLSEQSNIDRGTLRRTYDFGAWLADVMADPTGPPSRRAAEGFEAAFHVAFEVPLTTAERMEDDTGLQDELDSTAITSYYNYLNALVKDQLRYYTETLSGFLAASTTAFYRINKYERVGATRRLLQSFILPHLPGVAATDLLEDDLPGEADVAAKSVIDFVDTQLKYNTSYDYDIMVNRFVVGSRHNVVNVYVPGPTPITLYYYGPDGDRSCPPPRLASAGVPALPPSIPGDVGNPLYSRAPRFGDAVLPITVPPSLAGTPRTGPPLGDEEPEELAGNPYYAEMDVEILPSYQIIELPYISPSMPWMTEDSSFGRGTILDNPPVAPDNEIVPFRGVNNKLLFLLNSGIGEVIQNPQPLSPGEQEYVDRLREMYADPRVTQILFENDDPAIQFEIFRTDRKPYSYEDFMNHKIATVDGGNSSEVGFQRVSAASYVDTVEPNTVYYYMFRSIDIHGHISYPTEVFEVRLVDNDGAVYPVVRVIDFPVASDYTELNRDLTRFLQIDPQVTQTVLNQEASAPAVLSDGRTTAPRGRSISLGVDDELMWGRSFKVRVTSKKTGRKIDININCKTEYDDTRTEALTLPSAGTTDRR